MDHRSLRTLAHNLIWRFEWQFHERSWMSATTTLAIFLVSFGTCIGARCWRRLRDWRTLLLLTAIGSTAFQYLFGALGWLYRYEAWLLVLNVVALSYFVRPHYFVASMLLILMPRAILDASNTMSAMQDRLYEHYLPALFVHAYEANVPIVVNDLGVMAYYNRNPVQDMFGLGSDEPLRMRLVHAYDAPHVASWIFQTGATVAVLQPCWPTIATVTPLTWKPVALWIIPHNAVFANYAIAFYATSSSQAYQLRRNLAQFESRLTAYPKLRHYLLPVDTTQPELQRMAGCNM